MKDLQESLDEIIYSETGAELVVNAQKKLGALADFVVDTHTHTAAYQFLSPGDAMPYESIHAFHMHDFLVQKGKDSHRVVVRSDDGTIYIIQPTESPEAVHTQAMSPLEGEDAEYVRGLLTGYVRTA